VYIDYFISNSNYNKYIIIIRHKNTCIKYNYRHGKKKIKNYLNIYMFNFKKLVFDTKKKIFSMNIFPV
jgi:hypothetical protein